MDTKIVADKTKPLELPFQWRDRKGTFHSVDRMETRHIFFTLRMIWNHSAPQSMKIYPYKRYRFGEFYTTDYMIRAIKALILELSKRVDLTSYYKNCLSHMSECIEKGGVFRELEQ